ncbi:hypothetical protein BZA70DRAFT_297896 [Myxozyma melibiosi]|uniref:STB6-like N-terminal domain-containing protein n=1 Tax=Myxozyma melibiosi TaxID=54550 RepID=A0ABR1F0W5_9ASCO
MAFSNTSILPYSASDVFRGSTFHRSSRHPAESSVSSYQNPPGSPSSMAPSPQLDRLSASGTFENRNSGAWSRSPSRRRHQSTRSPSRFYSADVPKQVVLVPCIPGLRFLQESRYNFINPGLFEIVGYEVYVVEQWATRRARNACIVCYTGNPDHVVTVASVTIPADSQLWPKTLSLFMDDLAKMNAKKNPYEPLNAFLYVTSLSSFPSSLTLIPVPDGDFPSHLKDFILNENLRRIGCGARSGITLNKPADASRDKFYQLYKLSDRVPFEDAVIDLVKLVQVCLYYFGLFKLADVDGLLCDMTEKALNTWWHDIGVGHYGSQSERSLGPTTVAAVLGMVVGCRHRLNGSGAPVPKDPFDMDVFQQSIGSFQRQYKLKGNLILDPNTRESLFKISGKISASERFAIAKVVKTTVQDLSGIHSQNASDVETTEYDKFLQNVYGHTLRYLFLGKGNAKEYERYMKSISKYAYTWENYAQFAKQLVPQSPSTSSPKQQSTGTENDATLSQKSTLSSHLSPEVSNKSSGTRASSSKQDLQSLSPRQSEGLETKLPKPSAAVSTTASSTYSRTDSDSDYDQSEEIAENQSLMKRTGSSLFDQVPDFVRMQRRERRQARNDEASESNAELTSAATVESAAFDGTSKIHLKDRMHRRKVKTDEALRKAGNYLKSKRGRPENEEMVSQQLYSASSNKSKKTLSGRHTGEVDNRPLSTAGSSAPSIATDFAGGVDDPDAPEVFTDYRYEDDVSDDGDEYDEVDEEAEEYFSSRKLRHRTTSEAESEKALGDETVNHESRASLVVENDQMREERILLEAIEDEFRMGLDRQKAGQMGVIPRRAYSFDDLGVHISHINTRSTNTESVPLALSKSSDSAQLKSSLLPMDTLVMEPPNNSCSYEDAPCRRSSFSVAEAAVFRRTEPSEYSPDYVLQLIKQVKRREEWCSSETKKAEIIRGDFELQQADLMMFYAHSERDMNALEEEYHRVVQREGYLANGIRDLDMEAARLQYEMRTLDQKLDELEESVDSFGEKVEALEDRLREAAGKKISASQASRGGVNAQKDSGIMKT